MIMYVYGPSMLGWFLTFILKVTALHGFPLDFSTLHLSIWIRDRTVNIGIQIEDFGFGNPPGFHDYYFIEIGMISIQVDFTFETLANLLKVCSRQNSG